MPTTLLLAPQIGRPSYGPVFVLRPLDFFYKPGLITFDNLASPVVDTTLHLRLF